MSTLYAVVDKHVNSVLLYVSYPLPVSQTPTSTEGDVPSREEKSPSPAPTATPTATPTAGPPGPSSKADVQLSDGEKKPVVYGCENRPGSLSAGPSCNGEGTTVNGSDNKKEKMKSWLGFICCVDNLDFVLSF